MHVRKYKIINNNGVKWVRFTFSDTNGKDVILERKLLKIVKVKRKLMFAKKRPVISLYVCVGNIGKKVSVNLVNRENYRYKVLIGRNFLKDTFLVSSSLKYTVEPICQKPFKKFHM